MTERERLFEWCVDEINAGRLTFEQCVRRYADADPELVALLRTVRATRTVALHESQAAQARVRARVMAGLDQASPRETPARPAPGVALGAAPRPARPALASPPARRQWVAARVAAIAAAVLLACGALGWGAGVAAAAALPGQPLYVVKRAQEWVALRSAWSDERRGVVLVSIADHRLAEATAEADQGSAAVARDLTSEYDRDIQEAIGLSVAMAATGQDNRVVLEMLATELARARILQARASSHGEQLFAQSLGSAVAAETQAIDHNDLKLPNGTAPGRPDGVPTESPESGTPQPINHGPPPRATPSPHGGGNG
jgi:hypothetical protein